MLTENNKNKGDQIALYQGTSDKEERISTVPKDLTSNLKEINKWSTVKACYRSQMVWPTIGVLVEYGLMTILAR